MVEPDALFVAGLPSQRSRDVDRRIALSAPDIFSSLSGTGAAELRRMKTFAVCVLGICVAVLVVSRLLQARYPVFGFVAAFAEAATIGGVADWYAVVALFRRPLGLPIPHTAIIPNSQSQIAGKLGDFIQSTFLERDIVEAKLRQVNFSAMIAAWLTDPERSRGLTQFLLRLGPEIMAAAKASDFAALVGRSLQAQIREMDLTPLIIGALRSMIGQGHHRGLLDQLLSMVGQTLTHPQTQQALRERIRAELPTLLRLYRADAYLIKKIAASAIAFCEEVRNDPEHPFRGEFDQAITSLIEGWEKDPASFAYFDRLKRDLLARPEIDDLTETLWHSLQAMFAHAAAQKTSPLQDHLTALFQRIGAQLGADAAMQAEIDERIVALTSRLVSEHRSSVSAFISDQVNSWDMARLVTLIENNIGKDLQYIRLNGTIIGGLIGLCLYSVEMLVRLL